MKQLEDAGSADSEALEMALDAVLSRYGIPLGFGNGADRGDLASDLADAARSVMGLPHIDGSER
jgi:hypothetical protein